MKINFIKSPELTRYWKNNGRKIEKTFKEVTGLSFYKKNIDCYITTDISCSQPVLMIKKEKTQNMIDNLIHELLHVLFTQNYTEDESFRNKWHKYWKGDYKKEAFSTKAHILLHASHYLVTKKLRKHRLNNIVNYSKRKEYQKSWRIVFRKGPDFLVRKYLFP